MTSTRTRRLVATALLASGWTALSFGALTAPAPVAAAQPTSYAATLAEAAQDSRVVAGDTLWLCEGTGCVARESGSRPGRLCRDLQRKAGTITAFVVDGKPLDAEALARCNN